MVVSAVWVKNKNKYYGESKSDNAIDDASTTEQRDPPTQQMPLQKGDLAAFLKNSKKRPLGLFFVIPSYFSPEFAEISQFYEKEKKLVCISFLYQ